MCWVWSWAGLLRGHCWTCKGSQTYNFRWIVFQGQIFLNKSQKKKHKQSKHLEHIFRACDFSQVHLALCPNPTPSTNFQIKLGYIMEITLVPLLPIWVLDDVVLGRIFGPVTAPCNLLPSQDQGSITSISYRTQLFCRWMFIVFFLHSWCYLRMLLSILWVTYRLPRSSRSRFTYSWNRKLNQHFGSEITCVVPICNQMNFCFCCQEATPCCG